MIISHSRKYVFVHTPKAAGTTVRSSLLVDSSRDEVFWGIRPLPVGNRLYDWAHFTIGDLRAYFPERMKYLEEYYSFCLCRNPIDRYFSAVTQSIKYIPHVYNFVSADVDVFHGFANNFALNFLRRDVINNDFRLVHFKPQVEFFTLDNRVVVDEIIKVEDLASMSGKVADILGSSLDDTKNRTLRKYGYDFGRLSAEARKNVIKFYERDFAELNYNENGSKIRIPRDKKSAENNGEAKTRDPYLSYENFQWADMVNRLLVKNKFLLSEVSRMSSALESLKRPTITRLFRKGNS